MTPNLHFRDCSNLMRYCRKFFPHFKAEGDEKCQPAVVPIPHPLPPDKKLLEREKASLVIGGNTNSHSSTTPLWKQEMAVFCCRTDEKVFAFCKVSLASFDPVIVRFRPYSPLEHFYALAVRSTS